MTRNQIIKVLTRYGFSAMKALEIAIDIERDNTFAKSILRAAEHDR